MLFYLPELYNTENFLAPDSAQQCDYITENYLALAGVFSVCLSGCKTFKSFKTGEKP